MELIIRNTSRDRSTKALRQARPGDVNPSPLICKVRLPPGGTLGVPHSDLTRSDLSLVTVLMGCGCLKVFCKPSFGPLRQMDAAELESLCDFPEAAPVPVPVPTPEPEPIPEPEPEPEPVAVAIQEEETVEVPEPEPADEASPEVAPYLEEELKSMKNSQLRDILSDMEYGRTTGMNKAALVAAVLETQES